MKHKYIYILSFVAIVAIIVLKLATNKSAINEKKQASVTAEVAIPVKVAQAALQEIEMKLVKTGSLTPFREGNVLTAVAGTVQKINFQLGSEVKAGQVLALSDTKLLKLDLHKAELTAKNLARDLQTYVDLAKVGAATVEKVNELNQSHQDALVAVDQIKKQLSDAQVKAPISGVIAEKTIEEGVFATAGFQVAKIVNLSQLKVQLNLTEKEAYSVALGQTVKITTEVYPDKVFTGKISFISPQADEALNYKVEILASNNSSSPLRSGTLVYADFSRSTKEQMLVIPREAIVGSIKDASVFVAEGGKAKLRKIKIGDESGQFVQVLDGLKQGEKVVSSGQINLREGTSISISK